jgi:hypothetical protein
MVVAADGSVVKIDPPAVPPGPPVYPLGRDPHAGDALYLGFKPNPNNLRPFPAKMRFLALKPAADTSGVPQRVGEQNRDLVPPVDLVWEFRPKKDQDVWERLNVFSDGTVAFMRDGYVDVAGPPAIEPSVPDAVKVLVGEEHYWIRVRLDQNSYPAGRAPKLEYFLPNSVDAVNLVTEGEQTGRLGVSNGRAEQYFDFPERPVEPDSLRLEVRTDGVAQVWKRVDDFFASGRAEPAADEGAVDKQGNGERSDEGQDEVFVLDATAGRVRFGDGERGRIPPAGAEIVATLWRHGGGAAGNQVGPGAVTTMVTQVAGIERVTNVRAATGGADEEDLDTFIKQAPAHLLSGDRAVTARDFESLALSIDGVKKARALGGRHPDFPDAQVPGAVTVLVVPDSDALPPKPSAELIRSVCQVFESARLITTEVYAAAPRFLEVRVEARIFAAPEAAFDQVATDARQRLDDFLNPRNRQFGEDVSPAALFAQLFGRPGTDTQVRSVEDLLIYVDGRQHDARRPVAVPPDAIVYPGSHLIVVRGDQDERFSR